MPMEMRKLAFTQDELQAALVNYALRQEMKMPRASMERMVVKQDKKKKSTTVVMLFPTDIDTGERKRIEFTEAQTAAAIIMYCKMQKIPLPRNARKTLSAENESVAIIMSVNWDKVEPQKK